MINNYSKCALIIYEIIIGIIIIIIDKIPKSRSKKLDGADALFPPVLIGGIKSDQPLISLEDNAVREGFNNGEVRRQLG